MRYLIIALFLVSCKNPFSRVIDKFPDGAPSVVFNYPDGTDTSNFSITVFHVNGKIKRTLTVKDGKFIGKVITYSRSGKVIQVDSLKKPCDTLIKACDAARTGFYENGKIAERSNLENGKYQGFSQHYDHSGILVKEYFLQDDSIKTGMYKEYDTLEKLVILRTYRNDTLVGYSYFFKSNGDTLKYYFNEHGNISLPYKKWLNDGKTLIGNYTSKEKKAVLWTWYKNGIKTKSKVVIPNRWAFVVPE